MLQNSSESNRLSVSFSKSGNSKMASVAEKKRRKKGVTVARASEVKVERKFIDPTPQIVNKKRDEPIETGLAWLRRKNRVNHRQHAMGEDYAEWFRGSRLSGAEHLRSCLESDMPRGGVRGDEVSTDYADTQAWLADCKIKLGEARVTLNYHSGMVAVLDMICGAGMKPREISPNQRETEQMETTLRLALDLLDAHFHARR